MLTLLLHWQVAVAVILDDSSHTLALHRRRDERGSVTMEQVLWAVAVIVIVGIVVAAITGYVTDEAAKIK
ncbi:hypothetical protein GCM10023339_41160 [Alloalcanivorax gelatiniphagus]